jgi:hypothetical protein
MVCTKITGVAEREDVKDTGKPAPVLVLVFAKGEDVRVMWDFGYRRRVTGRGVIKSVVVRQSGLYI